MIQLIQCTQENIAIYREQPTTLEKHIWADISKTLSLLFAFSMLILLIHHKIQMIEEKKELAAIDGLAQENIESINDLKDRIVQAVGGKAEDKDNVLKKIEQSESLWAQVLSRTNEQDMTAKKALSDIKLTKPIVELTLYPYYMVIMIVILTLLGIHVI